MPITTCIFDAYGTLFDVGAAAREAAATPGGEALGERAAELAGLWRDKQLDYTWLRAAAGRHADFRVVTEASLDWVLAAMGLEAAGLRGLLLGLYDRLAAYREVPEVLAALKARQMQVGILSNGTPEMLQSAIAAAGIGGSLDAVLSAEAAGVYKPADAVYALVGQHFGCTPAEVLFISSNGWDAAAAAGYGFDTVWVNRGGQPEERLWARPARILPDLTPLPELV